MPFFGTVTERDFRENIKSTETYTDDATLRSVFRQTRSVARFGFFQNSRLRVMYGRF